TNDAARMMLRNTVESNNVYGAMANTVSLSTSTSALQAVATGPLTWNPANWNSAAKSQTPLEEAIAHLFVVVEKEDWVEKVCNGLIRCGIAENRGENLGALALVRESQTLMSTGSTGPALPKLRDAIHRTLDELLKACRNQEKLAGGEAAKVRSVGRQAQK